ncbi:MAG: adenosine kinase [bacterium]|nr:adenosine kinase [bacterium]
MSIQLNENAEYDVVGIGSALLDFIIEVEDSVLKELGLNKGEMHLIDAERSKEILDYLKSFPMIVSPGGSSANTLAGISNLGGKGIFLGKVGNDNHGDIYIRETEKAGVKTVIGKDESASGHAITFITPDSERTFATHLGAALTFNESDVSEEAIKGSKILHLEGYLFEPPVLNQACMKAMKIAHEKGLLISIDLSDPGLIGRISGTFKEVVRDYADIIFVNEEEAKAFTGKEEENALDELAAQCTVAVVKLGSHGSLIKTEGETTRIPIYETNVVNTNGAGDMYASGVLYGLASGFPIEKCGKLGSYASSLVVGQVEARLSEKVDINKI